MSQTARQAQQAAEAITTTHPPQTMLAGRPSDHLHDLLTRAASPQAASANQRR